MCPLSLLKGDAHLGKRVSLYSRHKLRRTEKLSVIILPSTELDPLLTDAGVFPIGVPRFFLLVNRSSRTNESYGQCDMHARGKPFHDKYVVTILGVSPFMISM
jgi:hypothetical protein